MVSETSKGAGVPAVIIPRTIVFALHHYYDSFSARVYEKMEKEYTAEPGVCLYTFKQEFENNPPNGVKDFNDFFYNHFLPFEELIYSLFLYDKLLKRLKTDLFFIIFSLWRFLIYIFILWYAFGNH
jgi:type IV secretory pathway VirB6-like protein